MTVNETAMLAGILLFATFASGTIYAAIFRATSKLVIGSLVSWPSAFAAGIVGIVAFVLAAGIFYIVINYAKVYGVIVVAVGYAAVLGAQWIATSLLLRTADGKRVGFLGAFKILILPTVLIVGYSYVTRPDIGAGY
ncbi:MAG TPA: hypothetical protein VGO52_14845 [Hyphomonadaceae bacterium]|nr:hypothetical protein [Hyphomonadaceae bacterium]